MVSTRTQGEVLHEIEQDLQRDEDLWKHIHSNLRELDVPAAHGRRRQRLVAAVVASVVALFAAFGLGWQLAPEASTGTSTQISSDLSADPNGPENMGR